MVDVNMNVAHRRDFMDPRRGEDAMDEIGRMIERHRVNGEPISLGDHVLEIGAAFGSTTVLLRAEVDRLTAVEMDRDMAVHAADRVADSNAEVVNVDAAQLPFPDDTFSAAVCTYMLHHVPSTELQDRVIAEAARVLRPGGVLFGWDSLDGPEIREYHQGDVFVPVDLPTFPHRLREAGFSELNVEPGDQGHTVYFAARVA